jgi:hypothetical protein
VRSMREHLRRTDAKVSHGLQLLWWWGKFVPSALLGSEIRLSSVLHPCLWQQLPHLFACSGHCTQCAAGVTLLSLLFVLSPLFALSDIFRAIPDPLVPTKKSFMSC